SDDCFLCEVYRRAAPERSGEFYRRYRFTLKDGRTRTRIFKGNGRQVGADEGVNCASAAACERLCGPEGSARDFHSRATALRHDSSARNARRSSTILLSSRIRTPHFQHPRGEKASLLR